MRLYTINKSADGVYFIEIYHSRRLTRFGYKSLNSLGFNFKYYRHKFDDIRTIILALTKILDCEAAVACAGHSSDLTNIQKACGTNVMFQVKWDRPKKHLTKIPDFYMKEIQRLTFKADKQYSKLLLVDDIRTTGETMQAHSYILKQHNIEHEMFCISHKECDYEKIHAVCITDVMDNINLDDFNLDEIENGYQ